MMQACQPEARHVDGANQQLRTFQANRAANCPDLGPWPKLSQGLINGGRLVLARDGFGRTTSPKQRQGLCLSDYIVCYLAPFAQNQQKSIEQFFGLPCWEQKFGTMFSIPVVKLKGQ